MANVNCLQYATRGDNNTDIPTAIWTSDGWSNYLAEPTTTQTAKSWSSFALAVKKLVMTTTGWKVPKDTGTIKTKTALNNSGVDLIRSLSGNAALGWTKRSTTAIPTTDGVIVLGDFSSGGGVHYFARVAGQWMGVPGPTDTIPQEVIVTGNSSFQQTITGGSTKSGTILGWFL